MIRLLPLLLAVSLASCADSVPAPDKPALTDRGIGGTGTPPVQDPPVARVKTGVTSLSVTSDSPAAGTIAKPKP